jgi:hypothetical protein
MRTPDVVLDRVTRVTPFGIRFWDRVTDRIIADGLAVDVCPKGEPERPLRARANAIGTFVLPRLPGARDIAIEDGAGDAAFWQTVQTRPYVIDVTDCYGRFQPFTIEQPLPARGLAMPPCLPPASPPIEAVPIFSTPARVVPDGMTVVRTELMVLKPGRGELVPASWAVLEVHVAGQAPARGIADRQGRVAVIVPYPELAARPMRAASPPNASSQPLWEQEWTVRLAAFYDAVAPPPIAPDLCRTLAQRAAPLWSDVQASRPLPTQVLRYGEELIVRNAFITTVGSMP